MPIKRFLKIALLLVLVAENLAAQQPTDLRNNMNWWTEARFGMFVHWGLYSVAAGDWKGKPSRGNEHFMLYEKVPLKEYARIADDFNPVEFDAETWVKMAKDAGMKYLVFTTKHHDGYAMYDSKVSEYNILKTTKWARDPLKELAAACKKHGLKLGLYYSLGRDWEDPDVPTNWPEKGGRSNTWDYPNEDAKDFSKYFERKVKPQITELLSEYGPISVMWFDTPEQIITKVQSTELESLIRKLQPGCIINSRIGNGLGDYLVTEQQIAAAKMTKPWEACITMSGKWSYNRHDNAWKSPELMIRQLVEIVSKGGNLLLNISPDGKGAILDKTKVRMDEIGKWMKINKEAIYGTQPWVVNTESVLTGVQTKEEQPVNKATMKDTDNDNTSKEIAPDIYFTSKAGTIYVFARSWKAVNMRVKTFAGGTYKIKKVALLGSSSKIKWQQNANGLQVEMPESLPNTVPVYVFKVTI
jgi:alpha-L-fucosidase